MSERIVVAGAHPDDVDFASAGTMCKWASEGNEIYYLICTNGDKGGTRNDQTPEELAKIRRKEQEDAAAIVGVKKIFFLGRKDGELVADSDLKKDIVRVIRRIRPSKVFSFDPANQRFDGFHLYHSDHRAVALAVFDAIYPASKNRLYFPELLDEGLEPHRINELYFYATEEPNVWIDITGTIDRKIQALKCHVTQFGDGTADQIKTFVYQRAKSLAKYQDFEYAEAFRVISFSL